MFYLQNVLQKEQRNVNEEVSVNYRGALSDSLYATALFPIVARASCASTILSITPGNLAMPSQAVMVIRESDIR